MPRCRFLRNTDVGQGTQQAIQNLDIRLTGFGQVINAAHFISECIGNPKARSRAEPRLRA